MHQPHRFFAILNSRTIFSREKTAHPFKTTHPVGSFNPPQKNMGNLLEILNLIDQAILGGFPYNHYHLGWPTGGKGRCKLPRNMLLKLDHFPRNRGENINPLELSLTPFWAMKNFKAPSDTGSWLNPGCLRTGSLIFWFIKKSSHQWVVVHPLKIPN